MTEKTSTAFECRRSCLFSEDGALLALVRIECPAGQKDTGDAGHDEKKDEKSAHVKKRKRSDKELLPAGADETVAAYCARISSDLEGFAENVLFPKIREEYEKNTDEGKRFRFVKYVYSASFRKSRLDDGTVTVLAEARLTRGGRTLAAGIEGAAVTDDGILPPVKNGKKKRRRSEVIIPAKDGKNVRFYLTSSGTLARNELTRKKLLKNCEIVIKKAHK